MESQGGLLRIQNFINGQFVRCDKYLDSYDPSTGEVWAQVPDSSESDVNNAVFAAKQAFQLWSAVSRQERSKIMNKIADILESRLEEFAEAESRDQGKPVSLARNIDIPRAVYNMRFFANGLMHIMDTSEYLEHVHAMNYTTRMPLGVAGLISPWNLPLYLLTFKIAPAIAFGNTVVCKPSEMTSVTAWMLCSILNEAGLPHGVINMVFGTGPRAGEAIVKHPDIHLISFTGSTATATHIKNASAPLNKKLSLELGGKNAGIIFKDADLEKVIPNTVRSAFTNQGEVCLCTSRLFVQDEIYQTFLQKFVAATKALKVGNPKDDVFMGALISADHHAKVKGFIDLARQEGASLLCGDGIDPLELPEKNKKGYFIRPTIITDVADTSALMQEEIFGPVVCVVPFTLEEEVVARANSVKYGLCASVWTQNLGTAHRVAQKLQVGTVWTNCWMVRSLNMPFGGMKASGIGREGLDDSMDFFTEKKTVCVMTT